VKLCLLLDLRNPSIPGLHKGKDLAPERTRLVTNLISEILCYTPGNETVQHKEGLLSMSKRSFPQQKNKKTKKHKQFSSEFVHARKNSTVEKK